MSFLPVDNNVNANEESKVVVEEEKQSFGTNPLDWDKSFKSSERAKLIDLSREEGYRNVLDLLRDKAKVRAERLLNLIETKKIAWYKVEEPHLHEVLGIERAQHRRMKLIMAKLSSKRAAKPKADTCTWFKGKKASSFLERTAATATTKKSKTEGLTV